MAAAIVCLVVVGGLLAAVSAFAAGDVNEAGCAAGMESSPGFRAWLPDCRAYEIVSESNSGDVGNVVGSYGFAEGAHVYYKNFLPTPGAGARSGVNERFLATRTSSGWMQRAISLPQGEGPTQLSLAAQENAEGVVLTGDFSEAFVKSPFQDPFEEPKLNKSTGMGVYKLSLESGAVLPLSLPDSGELTQSMLEGSGAYAGFAEVNDWGAFMVGGSADGSRAFFVTTAKLATAPGTPQDTHEASNEIYERTGGHTYLVGLLPDGSVPVCGTEVGQGVSSTLSTQAFYSFGAVAPNGTNVVFFSPGPEAFGAKVPCNDGGLFLRDVVHDATVRLPGAFYAGRAGIGAGEEEKIFTMDPGSGGTIYEYHVGTRQTTEVGVGDLLAYSADGLRVYFLGAEEGIYLYEEGRPTRRISGTQLGGYRAGTIGGGLVENIETTAYGQTHNMPVTTRDGSRLLFIDSGQLTTGYENRGHFEAYVYDAETGKVTCVSCNPTGAPPPTKEEEEQEGRALSEVLRTQLIDDFSMDSGEQQYQTPSPPFISNDGSRAVFETNQALLPQDVNGTMDVYEWEREDVEGCTAASLRVKNLAESPAYSPVVEGCLYLLSSGLGMEVPNEKGIANGTHLVGASENLGDVYIQTSESLLPRLDNASKLYDVRIDGGFPYPPSGTGCEAEQCKTMSGEPAPLGAFTTEGFAGHGDVKNTVAHRSRKPTRSARRARRLARALKACRKHKDKRKRQMCERTARRRYRAKITAGIR